MPRGQRVALLRLGRDKNDVEGASAAADRNRIGCDVHAARHAHREEAGVRAYRSVASHRMFVFFNFDWRDLVGCDYSRQDTGMLFRQLR